MNFERGDIKTFVKILPIQHCYDNRKFQNKDASALQRYIYEYSHGIQRKYTFLVNK